MRAASSKVAQQRRGAADCGEYRQLPELVRKAKN
jgi:hypothetical protein